MITEGNKCRTRHRPFRWAVTFLILAIWFAAAGTLIQAAEGLVALEPAGAIVVNKAADTDDGSCDVDCSLREAIILANSDAAADVIIFNLPPTSTLPLAGNRLPTIDETLTIDGSDVANLEISGINASSIFRISSGTAVTLTNLTVTGGDATGGSDCPTSCGGAIYSEGQLSLVATMLKFNDAQAGGAIYNDGGTLAIEDSAIYGNDAENGGGVLNSDGQVTIHNSTFAGNEAFSEFGVFLFGGGIFNDGMLTIHNSTFSNNSAPFGGGLFNNSNGTLHMSNTIIAGSSNDDCYDPGTIATNVNNLVEDGTCAENASGLITADPLLGSLQDNGGPTLTKVPQPGSPAIDAGAAAHCLPADQRGAIRPQDGDGDGEAICDIGAVEVPAVQTGPHFTVTVADDPGDGHCGAISCTLREAIGASNRSAGANDIIFDLPPESTILLSGSSLPAVTGTLTIDGRTAISLTLDGNDASRILEIGSGTAVTVTTLTFANGHATGDFSFERDGGAIYNDGGMLTVDNSVFRSNTAEISGGAIDNNSGTLTLNESHFDSNTAAGAGGGLRNYGPLTVTSSSFSGNAAGSRGGGLSNENGPTVISGTVFSENTAETEGGGIYNEVNLSIVTSSFTGNTAADGGGLFNYEDGGVAVRRSTFSDNAASDEDDNTDEFGGGIGNDGTINLSNSTLHGNAATSGGGLFNTGEAFIYSSTFSGNRAISTGGGIHSSGTLHLRNTILANNAQGGDCNNEGTLENNTNNLIEDGSCTQNAINLITGDPQLGPLGDNGGPTLTHALRPDSAAIDAGDDSFCAIEPVSNRDQRGFARPVDGDNDDVAICDIGAVEHQPEWTIALPLIVNRTGP